MSSTTPLALASSTVGQLGPEIAVPAYERAALRPGIVHLGVGGFHRAHQAFYLDRLHEERLAEDWGIIGVGVLERDRPMKDALAAQDCLYTLVEKADELTWRARIIGSLIGYHLVADERERVLSLLADPSTRIVSLTITEAGYNVGPDGCFDAQEPAVRADLEAPRDPKTVFGIVVEALRRRRDAGVSPFTVLSCDNLQGNGHVARRAFVSFAELVSAPLGRYVESTVAFPSAMVDRITPVTTNADREAVATRFGIADRWPVVCEPFVQWVVEDEFTLGRPPLNAAGVQLVGDVLPYELMKLRMLNASHQLLAYTGALAGYRFVHEALADPLFAELLRRYMRDEAQPTLRPVPGVDLEAYRESVIARFANPAISDTLERLRTNSTDLIQKFLLPVVRDELEAGGPIDVSAFTLAAWAHFVSAAGAEGLPDDRRAPLVLRAAQADTARPGAFLEESVVFGDTGVHPRLRSAYAAHRTRLLTAGAPAALRGVLADGPA